MKVRIDIGMLQYIEKLINVSGSIFIGNILSCFCFWRPTIYIQRILKSSLH